MKKAILFSMLAVFSVSVSAQTGPGGVGNSATNPYWIDVHSSIGSNGVAVSSLPDFSGNGIDAVQADITAQPLYITNAVNGVSALFYDGGDCLLSGATPTLNNQSFLDYYVFGNINTVGTTIPLNIDFGTPSSLDAYTGVITLGGQHRVYARTAAGALVKTSYGAAAGFNLFQGKLDTDLNELTSVLNFNSINTITTATTGPGLSHEGIWLGGKNTAYKINGSISEAFIFNTILNTAEDKIVQNYISAKFGTVIADDMYAYQATHQFGVIGIGQEDVANNHLNSIGNGIVRISKNTLNDGDYLFTGHDGAEMSVLAFDVPVSMVNGARFSRVWRADEPSDIGAITLVFDLDPVTDFSADPNNYRLLIDHTDSDFSTVDLQLAGTYNAGTQEVTFTGVDLQAGDFYTLAGDEPQDIISITTGLWSLPTTWNCSCVPTPFDNVTVDNGHIVTLDVDAGVSEFTINPTGDLTWLASEQLTVSENLVINGALNMGATGIFEMGGVIADQSIDLGGNVVDFTNLIINNLATSVTLLNGTVQMNGTLSPNDGVFDYSAGDLIINSISSTTTGRVGTIIIGASLVGNVTVKRFLPPGNADSRTIASPVIGANLSEWDADIAISGVGFPDGCAWGPDGCFQSCKMFKGGDFSDSYIDVTNPNESLENGVGYELFIGDDLNTFSGATLSSTGTLHDRFDFTQNIGAHRWNIIGNPYASPIFFDDLVTANISNYYYVFDAQTGSYQWYQQGGGSSIPALLGSGAIAIGQGIWVYGGFGGPLITYKQSSKMSNANFIRSNITDASIFLELTQEGTTYKNVVNVDFNDNAFDDMDSLDMLAFTIGKQRSSSLYINSGEELLAKNYLNTDGRDKVLDLSLKILEEGYFTITAKNLENVYNYTNITLVDLATKELIDLRKTNYTFFAIEDDENRQRFQLVLSNEGLGNTNTSVFGSSVQEAVAINQIGNAIDINSNESIDGVSIVSLTNVLGQNILFSESVQIQEGTNMVYLPIDLKGFFIVSVKTSNGLITKKIML